ncbi:MAG: ankyrin repeat domain-containing protein [Gemmataceae bacterium]|nr:ankyrin repeat domain-containing protein [Gemmataceae bacterium]
MVRDFVAVAHKDLDKVREMLDRTPALLNASWDWGGGDWETALGAAAHTGRKEIAKLLLDRGARLDIFAAAMLGRIEIVRAAVTTFPGTVKARGPHGIPLIDHARMGKEDAAEVLKFLEPLVANA